MVKDGLVKDSNGETYSMKLQGGIDYIVINCDE
jgi:hypothetical protein